MTHVGFDPAVERMKGQPIARLSDLDSERRKPYVRLAGFALLALAAAATVTFYLLIPLMVTLRAVLPNGVVLFLVALGLLALGEGLVIRVLIHTSPQRAAAPARSRERRQAFSGPTAFDVELRPLNAGIGRREFPALGRAIAAGPDELVVRVGSGRWRNYRGLVDVTAYLASATVSARAQLQRAEEITVRGRMQCVLHLRLIAEMREGKDSAQRGHD
jgi:hypothetical protein